ncbi:hypothetical protein J4732_22785 [Serratia marcescens]|uniref:Uncharacterized protein n=1 Tax=Serratia marcescens TaxID=615 RepID=A0A939NMY2_SERMA|nr:hypothetical protein [Serratia marcescens]
MRCVCGKKSAQIREILISESAWEEMTCLFASLAGIDPVTSTVITLGTQINTSAQTLSQVANKFVTDRCAEFAFKHRFY